MKILFEVGHPAHVHLFKNAARYFIDKGYTVKIFAREREALVGGLLKAYGIDYDELYPTATGIIDKAITLLKNNFRLLKVAKQLKPDIFISPSSPYSAQVSYLAKKPHLAFEDTECSCLVHLLSVPFTDVILTPDAFRKKLPSKKHVKYLGYKELAYLHPNWFKPNPDIFDMLDVSKNENYIILRFSAFDASHDIGINGFSLADKRELVKELEKDARIFISSEIELPQDLKKYVIKIPPHKMHDALYYASLLVGDTGTMVTEAGILGTPAIISHPQSLKMSNFIELEQKYGLIFNIHEPRMVIEKAVELLQRSDLNQEWRKRRENLLRDKIDVTAFMTWFIEQYPESFTEMKANPDYQEKFK